MKKYDPKNIEKKWQKKWYNSTAFRAQNPSTGSGQASSKKEKFYLLFEFPYPSGDGLHVGHCRPYIALDIIARKRRMQGQNVLFPMGWDAFGLPTENYAIKKGIHPAVATKKNTDNFRKQMKNIGLSLDWSREINTTDPAYYKWTQWIFIKLFEKGLAYKDKININWCPSCKIGLANEEVIGGKCERCGTPVEKKEKSQWLIKITKYADRLINDLSKVDYPERVKDQQINWIGRSEGVLVKFPLEGLDDSIEVFTTRIDTIFSGTFLILAPGHKFIDRHKDKIENMSEVLEYKNNAKNISDIERTNTEKEVTGVQLKGIMVKNPATNEQMPVWIADFVLEQYGTGAVFADAHDARDFKFAKKYNVPLRASIIPTDEALAHQVKNLEVCFEDEGTLYNSLQFDGLSSAQARPKITEWLAQKRLAEPKVNYKLRDWIFSRQHYWGEPIPMIHCNGCGWMPVPGKDLPVKLPNVKKYQPTDTGESPLAVMTQWVNVKCPQCKQPAKRETDTMPNWAGSNWYYLAYAMQGISNFQFPISKYEKVLKHWMPVDWYNGGMEHTTLHLLYSRFVFKFLWDIGAVPKSIGNEPYKKRTSHGIVLGPGGIKMSKSRGNVINPDDVVKQYGADTLRVYEMFMGPFEQMIPWDEKGILGARRFIEKIYTLAHQKEFAQKKSNAVASLINRAVKKVSDDIEAMKFNTAISSLMILINSLNEHVIEITKDDMKNVLIIMSPFTPHLSEELWERLGFKGLCSQQIWPKHNAKLEKEEKVLMIIQVNGKVRDKMQVKSGLDQSQAEALAMQSPKIKPLVEGKQVRKVIYVKDKLINLVV